MDHLEIWIILFWANHFVQELTQLSNEGAASYSHKLLQHYQYTKYSSSFIFNYIDLIVVVATAAAFILRVVSVQSLSDGELISPINAYLLHQLYIAVFMLMTIRLLQVRRS